jgi:hypothetical protein
VVISCLYWLFRHLLALTVLRCRSEAANEVEILVLRAPLPPTFPQHFVGIEALDRPAFV